jgi:hypothetical protein
MKLVSRRQAMELVTSFLAVPTLLGHPAKAQSVSTFGATVFDMAKFSGAGVDPDAAFAKALAAIEKASADAKKGGGPAHITFNLE